MASHGFEQLATSDHDCQLDWSWRDATELTVNESISRRTDLAAEEREALVKTIAGQLRHFGILPEEELRAAAAETRVRYIALDTDGREIIAQAGGERSGCSVTGNCPFWVLSRREDKYDILLEGEAQRFAIQPHRTKKLVDIVLLMHSSAFDSGLVVYKFDGKKYRKSGCYRAEWAVLGKDGEKHQLHEPRITCLECEAN